MEELKLVNGDEYELENLHVDIDNVLGNFGLSRIEWKENNVDTKTSVLSLQQ